MKNIQFKKKVKIAIKSTIASTLNASGERSIVLEKMLNKMNFFKKEKFINKIANEVISEDIFSDEDLYDAIDLYLFNSIEYTNEYFKN